MNALKGALDPLKSVSICQDGHVISNAADCAYSGVPWNKPRGLQGGESEDRGTGDEMGDFSSANVKGGELDAADRKILAPVIKTKKGLEDASKDAAMSQDVLDLIDHCEAIWRRVDEVARSGTILPPMAMTLGEFKGEMEHLAWFVKVHNSRMECCRQTTSLHATKLRGLQDAVFASTPDPLDDARKAAVVRPRHRVTFISHAGEDKEFVRSLLQAIEEAKVPAFFDDDMTVGTSSVDEMKSRAAEADHAVVVLSRPFLTKEWPMKELNIFLDKKIKIYPLYYGITPDDLWDILSAYESR